MEGIDVSKHKNKRRRGLTADNGSSVLHHTQTQIKQRSYAERVLGAVKASKDPGVFAGALAGALNDQAGIKTDTAIKSTAASLEKSILKEGKDAIARGGRSRMIVDPDMTVGDLRDQGGHPLRLSVERKSKTFLHDAVLITDADPIRAVRKFFDSRVYDNIPKKDRDLHAYLFHRFAARVRAAEKYILDEAALKHIAEAADIGPSQKGWEQYWDSVMMMARLPHKAMFVEWEVDVLNEIKTANGTLREKVEKQAGRGGYLLQRVNPDDPTRWTAQYCCYLNNDDSFVDFGGVGFLFDSEGKNLPLVEKFVSEYDDSYHDMGLSMRRAAFEDPESIASMCHAGVWGILKLHKGDGFAKPHTSDRMQRSLRLMHPHIVCALAASQDPKYHGRRFVEATLDSRGDPRHLCVILALINSVPIKNVVREPQAPRLIGTRMVRRQTHNQINFINLRSTEVVKQLKRAGREYAKKILHPVRMHLRTVWTPQTPVCTVAEHRILDTYEPATDRGEKYVRCRKCGVIRRWIPDHQRGDESVGVSHRIRGVTSHR